MKEKVKRYSNPRFRSLEEEEKYWETHSPLAEGHEGKIQRSSQKRSSFLAVRLTGEELTRLRDIAVKQGVGPSTFARLLLTSAIERQNALPKRITLEQLKDTLEENLPQSVREKAEHISKAISICNPPFLLEISKLATEEWEDFALHFISSILVMAGVQVVTTKDVDQRKPKPELAK